MANCDICLKSKGCSRPLNHAGRCNDVLTYVCLCHEPEIEVLKVWRSVCGDALQCRKCHRCVDPQHGLQLPLPASTKSNLAGT